MKVLSILVCFLFLAAAGVAQEVDLSAQDIRLDMPVPCSSFVVPNVASMEYMRSFGAEAVSYWYGCGGERYLIQLVKAAGRDRYCLVLFCGEVVERVHGKSSEQRLEIASGSREVSDELASKLYVYLANTMTCVKYGYREVATGPRGPQQMISLFSNQTGLITAYSHGVVSGSEVDQYLEIGRCLKRFVQKVDGCAEGDIERLLRKPSFGVEDRLP